MTTTKKKTVKKTTKKVASKKARSGVTKEGRLYSYTSPATKKWLEKKAKENKKSLSSTINWIIEQAYQKEVKTA